MNTKGSVGFRLRLRVRIGKALTTNEVSQSITLAGQEVTIKSQIKDQALSEATWIVLGARGFATEAEAYYFGEQLRLMVLIAALCSRLGVDAGQDKSSCSIREDYARSLGLLQPHERLMPNIHGLTVLPDDNNSRFFLFEAQASITADPAQLLGAMGELSTGMPLNIAAAASGLRIFNLALMNPQPLAQVVLALSAVEALGQNEFWTEAQIGLIKKLATAVEEEAGDHDTERLEVADALRRSLHRIGLRQGIMRVLSRLGLSHLRREWDRLYSLRSGVFHGTVELTEQEIHQFATDSVRLCGKIILAVVAHDGIKLPSVADIHFGGT